jgi:ADP-heptose:LPS heptosyltransferase
VVLSRGGHDSHRGDLRETVNIGTQKLVFAGTSRLTDLFPVFGARLLDTTVRQTYGSRAVVAMFARRNRKEVKRVRTFRRFLMIPDIHIGDAVMSQAWLMALRDFFPNAEIDYVVNRTVAPLIEGNPDATRILPLFGGGAFPTATDIANLRTLITEGRYDLCLCACTFLEPHDVAGPSQPFLHFVTHGPAILRNERDSTQINHFSHQGYQFVRDLLSTVAPAVRAGHFAGVRTTYTDAVIEESRRFAAAVGLTGDGPVVMLNPDTASPFTLPPFESQATLLRGIAEGVERDCAILVGAGHTAAGIGDRLVTSLPEALRARVRIIPPDLPLAVYSALIDYADVFISGDTGPLHLAAARRYSRSEGYQFRNRTAVLSIFGATTPRMSGYDSFQPGYLPANQDAPSWCYQAGSPCRNITCLNKMFKTCATVRCFEEVDTKALAALVIRHLQESRTKEGRAIP